MLLRGVERKTEGTKSRNAIKIDDLSHLLRSAIDETTRTAHVHTSALEASRNVHENVFRVERDRRNLQEKKTSIEVRSV